MSLDIWFEIKVASEAGSGVFIRGDGSVREITQKEWDQKFPNKNPITTVSEGGVFSANITHNLGKMAQATGIYKVLWRPHDAGIKIADDLVRPLEKGLLDLLSRPKHFKQFNAPNGWGTYEPFVNFVRKVLVACRKYPHATVNVSV